MNEITEESMTDSVQRPAEAVLVELVLEGHHRLTGEIQTAGIPRRLVDVLNGIEGDFAVIQEACLQDLAVEGSQSKSIGIAQIPVESILFAIPRGNAPRQGDTFETVAKVPVPAVIVLPEYEIAGNVYLLPGTERRDGPIVATRRFAPVGGATITATSGGRQSWTEEIVVVNLSRALLYLARGAEGGSVEPPR